MRTRTLSWCVFLVASAGLGGCGEDESTGGTAGPPPVGPCPAGELELEDASCRPAGILSEECAVGFEPDGAMGCNAILPPDVCSDGLMAIPGETVCREVAPCGDGPWGDIPNQPGTQYVDGAYAAGDADGSQQKPWPTIQAGIDAAGPGAIVAVAAGSYLEGLRIENQPVRLWGRCPAMVQLTGVSGPSQAILILAGADGSEVRNLAISGPLLGVAVSGSENVVLANLWVHDTGDAGIEAVDILGNTSIAISDSLVDRAMGTGVHGGGTFVTIDRTAIRDTAFNPAYTAGWGIATQEGPSSGTHATIEVRDSLIELSRGIGANLLTTHATIERTVIRDGLPEDDGTFGRGISLETSIDGLLRSSLTLRASIIERNAEGGIFVGGSDAIIEATVLRDNYSQVSDGLYGDGVTAVDHFAADQRPSLVVRGSLIATNAATGVLSANGDLTLESTIIRDTWPEAAVNDFGIGVAVQDNPQSGGGSVATIRGCTIEGSRHSGILVYGSTAVVEQSLVRTTLVQHSDNLYGDGISVLTGVVPGAAITVDRCRIEGNARAGVASFGGWLGLHATVLECNPIQLTGAAMGGVDFAFEDLSDNYCGCGSTSETCKVATADLVPPSPVAPPGSGQ